MKSYAVVLMVILFFLQTEGFAQVGHRCAERFASAPLGKRDDRILNPEFLLAEKGLDPSLFVFKISRGDDGRPILEVDYDKVKILQIDVDKYGAPVTSSINENFKNRGVGTVSYLILARWIFEKTGRVFQSNLGEEGNDTYLSKDAQNLWRRLQIKGFARYVYEGNRMYRFFMIKDRIFEPGQIEALDRFLEGKFIDNYNSDQGQV